MHYYFYVFNFKISNRTPENELELWSYTGLPQQWGKNSSASKNMYKAVPLEEFCHVQPMKPRFSQTLPDDIPDDLKDNILQEFLLVKNNF